MNWLRILITIISILLIILILLQKSKSDDNILGGGSEDVINIHGKKRGLEKSLFKFTILIGIVFVVLNVFAIFIK